MDAINAKFQELANDPEVLTLLLGACFFAMLFSILQDIRNRYIAFKAETPARASDKKEEDAQEEVESTGASSSVKKTGAKSAAPKPKAFALPDTYVKSK